MAHDVSLRAAHIAEVLQQLSPTRVSSFSDLCVQLLQGLVSLPGTNSAFLVMLDTETQNYVSSWVGLEGELRTGEARPLAGTSWANALQHKTPHLEDLSTHSTAERAIVSAPSPGSLDLSSPSEPQQPQHRCVIPIHRRGERHYVVSLQSIHADHYTKWDQSLLWLMAQQIGATFRSMEAFDDLQSKLSFHHQQLSLMPPSLFNVMHMGQAFSNEATPVVSILQHNIDALGTYHRKLLNALEYYQDEIKLYANEEAIQRIEGFAKRNQLTDITSDLDLLMQDASSGLFQLRYYLNFLYDLRQSPSNQEQVQVHQLLQPLLSNLFNDKRIAFRFPTPDVPPLYGTPGRLRQAFASLLLSIPRYIDARTRQPVVSLETTATNDDVVVSIQYEAANGLALAQATNPEGYLFVKQVMEEQQGSFAIQAEGLNVTLKIALPIMFEDNTGDYDFQDMHTPKSFDVVGGAMELPALDMSGSLDLPTIESSDSFHELPATYNKIILLSADLLYARSLRRALDPNFAVYLAPTAQSALDLLNAHPDLAILLCDMEESVEDSFTLLDEIQTNHPQYVQYVCFLLGEAPPATVVDFARRLTTRCTERHAPLESLQRFINRRRRF